MAEKHLSSTAQSHIAALLAQGPDIDLPSIANWADEVRAAASDRGPLSDDPEARMFNAKFPTNALWHFVDLPLGAEDYREVVAFTSVNDVVHAIKRCVAVLERAQTGPEDFTKPQALRLLVHFVGDIHQPLHCGTGFYDLSDLSHPVLITDPRLCAGKPNDRGGNDLFFGSEPNQELHALWDESLVFAIRNTADYRSLADWLDSTQSVSSTTGDYHNWPEQWAIDSVQQATKSLSPPPVWRRCHRRATPSDHHSTANRLHRHKSSNRFRTVTESRAAFSQAFERDPMARLLTTNKIGGQSSVTLIHLGGFVWRPAP